MRALALAMTLVSAAAAAADGKATASVESNQVTVGVPFLLTVRAEGKQVGEFKLPQDADGLELDPRPVRTSTQAVFSGSAMRMTVERGFQARATRSGRVKVPPLGVVIDGSTVFTKEFELTVVPGLPVRPPRVASPEVERDTMSLEEAVFATSEVDKSEVYEQEPVRLTLSLWQLDHEAVDIEPYRPEIEPPATEGFYAVPRVPALVSNDRENRDGRPYRVIRFRQTLYPARTGELKVGEWTWEGSARFLSRGGRRYQDLVLQAPPVPVHVKGLPQPPPPDFRGAVGEFELRAELTDRLVAQGTPTKLVVRVIGRGNPDAVGDPVMPALENLQVSDPTRQEVPIQDPEGTTVEKNFVYALTPLRSGTLRIPEVHYTYFDVGADEYVTQTAGPFELEVTPSQENAQRVVVDASQPLQGQAEVSAEPATAALVLDPGVLQPQRGGAAGTAAVVMAPPLAFAALALLMARKRRFQRDVRYARSYHARARAHRRLTGATRDVEPTEAVYRALAGYVADKSGVAEAGLTSADVARLLEANGVDDELREGYLKILRACERARYGASGLSEDEQHALTSAAQANVELLETAFRGAGR